MSSPTQPDPFADTFVAMIAARAVISATALGIFDALAEQPATAAALAARLGLEPVGTAALATALEALGYLEQAGFAQVLPHRNERSPWRLVILARA